MRTNYAVIVSGEWGSGKTHYYKNTLKEIIASTTLISDERKKYTPILVSLFGINSIEEIQTQIILNLYPILKKRKTKLAASVGKAFFKGIMKMNGLEDYYNIVSEIEIDKKDWIRFNELVIVLDDLERISKSLEIEEVIGFVNSLVEHDNVKVLLIANEGKIDSESYKSIKEKVIGNSIEFVPSLTEAYDGLVNNFNGSSLYQKFLTENKDLIITFFSEASVNLRILIIALDYFQITFSSVLKNLPSIPLLKKIEKQILIDLLKFSLTISIEYKLGNITFKERNNIDSFISMGGRQNLFGTQEGKEKIKSYAETFKEKYFPGSDYYFYNSIYDFITGGNTLNVEQLIKELKELNRIDDAILPIHEQVIKDLTYRYYANLSNKEYETKTRQMLKYASEGKYSIFDYLTVFHFATRFSNFLKLNVDVETQKIISGIKRGKKDFEYNPSLSRHLNIGESAEFKPQMEKIRNATLKINDEINIKTGISKSKKVENIYHENFDEFHSTIFEKFHYEPILQSFNPYKFYLYFLNANNHTKEKVVNFYTLRYHQHNSNLKEELKFIKELEFRINNKLGKLKNNKLSDIFFHDLDKALKFALSRLESY